MNRRRFLSAIAAACLGVESYLGTRRAPFERPAPVPERVSKPYPATLSVTLDGKTYVTLGNVAHLSVSLVDDRGVFVPISRKHGMSWGAVYGRL